jgi:hypothetical protein
MSRKISPKYREADLREQYGRVEYELLEAVHIGVQRGGHEEALAYGRQRRHDRLYVFLIPACDVKLGSAEERGVIRKRNGE